MSNQSPGNRVQSQLQQAVEGGRLPDAVQQKAEKLLARLQKPVRLGLMGMPGAGKSKLLNLLVGSDVVPDGVRLPTMQVVYGDTPQSICTLPDGSKKTLDGNDAAAIAALSPVFVELHLPLPALAKISVLEVVAPDDPNALHRAAQWAAKRCDIALWCTRAFVETEQQIWSAMPDIIKDHAFCMITRADILRNEGLLDTAVGAVKSVASDEFSHILPIGTTEAIAARRPDGTVDKDRMRESGGLALISAVLKQVEHGKQSAIDMAEVLLHQYADVLAQEADTVEPEATPAPEVAAPEEPQIAKTAQIADAAPAEPEPAPAEAAPPVDAITRLRELAARKAEAKGAEADTEPEAPEEPQEEETAVTAPAPETAEPLRPATRETYQKAIAYIEEQGAELAEALTEKGDAAPGEVMALTVEHIQWLCDYLNDNGDMADQSLLRARDTAFDAADLVQLMQMEKRDSAALEAVSLMLQIKRELQADLAA